MANRSSNIDYSFVAPLTGPSSMLQLRWVIEPLPRGSEGRKDCSATTYLVTFRRDPQHALKLYKSSEGQNQAADAADHPKMTRELRIYGLLDKQVAVTGKGQHGFLPMPKVEAVPSWAQGRISEIMSKSPRHVAGDHFHEKCLKMKYSNTSQSLLELYTDPDFKTKFCRETRAGWLMRLLEILLECHTQGIAHGNLQTRHILIEPHRWVPLKESVKVLDWSCAVVKKEVLPSDWEAAAGRDAQALNNLNIILSEDGQSGGPDRHVIPEDQWQTECMLLIEPMDLTACGGFSDAELEAMGNRLFESD